MTPKRAEAVGISLYVLAIVLAIALHIAGARQGALSLDEHVSYWTIDSVTPSTTHRRSLDVTALPPLSAWTHEASIAVFGRSEFALRLPSVAFAVAAVALIGIVGRTLSGRSWLVGGTAAMLLACDPNVLDQTRVGRCYGLVLLLAVCLMWASVQWSRETARWSAASAWLVCAVALVWTHYLAGLFVAVSFAATVAIGHRNAPEGTSDRTGPAIAGAIALILVALAWPLVTPLFRLQILSETLNNRELTYSLVNLTGPILFVAMVGWFLVRAERRHTVDGTADRPIKLLLLCCSLVPVIIVWALTREGDGAIGSPRYRLPYLPPACLLLAIVANQLQRWLGIVLVVAAIAANIALAPPQQRLLYADDTADDERWKSIALILQDQASDQDVVFVQGGLAEGHVLQFLYEDRLFSDYVACRLSRFYLRRPIERVGVPYFWDRVATLRPWYLQRLSQASEKGAVWVAAAIDTDLNRNSLNGLLAIIEEAGFDTETVQGDDRTVLLRLVR